MNRQEISPVLKGYLDGKISVVNTQGVLIYKDQRASRRRPQNIGKLAIDRIERAVDIRVAVHLPANAVAANVRQVVRVGWIECFGEYPVARAFVNPQTL